MQDEKFNEKAVEKRDEKVADKGQEDLVSAVVGGSILIWAGLVLLAGNRGYSEQMRGFLDSLSIQPYSFDWEVPFFGLAAVQLFLLGAGAILVVEGVIRLLVPAYRRSVAGTFIGAVVLLSLAVGKWQLIWPLIVIAIGASILVSGLVRRR